MRRREISEPNLAARMMQNKLDTEKNEAKLRRNGFSSGVHLQKKKSDDTTNMKKPKRSKKLEEGSLGTNVLMELEQIKNIQCDVKELHQKVQTIDRQMTARH